MFINHLFMEGIKLPEPLTNEEIYELFQQVQLGNQEAKKKIIIHNIRLVLKEVQTKFNNNSFDKEELVAVGLVGLTKSVDKFNPKRGVVFNTFAVTVIDNEIRMFMRRENKHNNDISSLSVITYDLEGNELTIEDQLYDENINIEEDYIHKEDLKECIQLLHVLPERDRKIVMLYLGFDNDIRYTQDELAQMFSISRSYISKIINNSFSILKKYSEYQEIYFKFFHSQKHLSKKLNIDCKNSR